MTFEVISSVTIFDILSKPKSAAVLIYTRYDIAIFSLKQKLKTKLHAIVVIYGIVYS